MLKKLFRAYLGQWRFYTLVFGLSGIIVLGIFSNKATGTIEPTPTPEPTTEPVSASPTPIVSGKPTVKNNKKTTPKPTITPTPVTQQNNPPVVNVTIENTPYSTPVSTVTPEPTFPPCTTGTPVTEAKIYYNVDPDTCREWQAEDQAMYDDYLVQINNLYREYNDKCKAMVRRTYQEQTQSCLARFGGNSAGEGCLWEANQILTRDMATCDSQFPI